MTLPASPPAPLNGNKWPRIAIIIINYRGRSDTLECLGSLAALTYPGEREIVVVDQPPSDGAPEAIRSRFPGVHVIENCDNNGFAGGNNIGIRAALARGVDYVLLLNNDTLVDPSVLEPLIARAESDERIGIVGPKMLYYNQPKTVWSVGGRVDWRGNSLLLGEGACEDDPAVNAPADVDYVVGCGLLAKRAVWEQVGPLDERYFLYFEETDLCARARKAGWRVVYEPGARLWHKVSRSTGEGSPLTLYYMRRNSLLYVEQHGQSPWLGRLALIYDTMRLAMVWTLQRKTDQRRVLLSALRDYLGRRFGKAKALHHGG